MHVYTSVLKCWQPNWPFARQVESQTRNIANKPQLLVLKGVGESIYVTVGDSKQAVHSRICSQHPLQVPLYISSSKHSAITSLQTACMCTYMYLSVLYLYHLFSSLPLIPIPYQVGDVAQWVLLALEMSPKDL